MRSPPRKSCAQNIDEVEAVEDEAVAAIATGYQPMILIAEDDPDMQNMLTHLLQDHAIVRCVGTARKAVEAANEQRF